MCVVSVTLALIILIKYHTASVRAFDDCQAAFAKIIVVKSDIAALLSALVKPLHHLHTHSITKSFVVTCGPNFSMDLSKQEGELTAEMIQR